MKIRDIKPKYALLILLFLLLTSYSLFQARFLILGPQIWINYPEDGATVENSLVTIEGDARNVAWISLNDHQIFTDESGKWSEKLIVSQGLSIMTVKARDRFGRVTEKQIRIVLN
jgi:hypothetical protein